MDDKLIIYRSSDLFKKNIVKIFAQVIVLKKLKMRNSQLIYPVQQQVYGEGRVGKGIQMKRSSHADSR